MASAEARIWVLEQTVTRLMLVQALLVKNLLDALPEGEDKREIIKQIEIMSAHIGNMPNVPTSV